MSKLELLKYLLKVKVLISLFKNVLEGIYINIFLYSFLHLFHKHLKYIF